MNSSHLEKKVKLQWFFIIVGIPVLAVVANAVGFYYLSQQTYDSLITGKSKQDQFPELARMATAEQVQLKLTMDSGRIHVDFLLRSKTPDSLQLVFEHPVNELLDQNITAYLISEREYIAPAIELSEGYWNLHIYPQEGHEPQWRLGKTFFKGSNNPVLDMIL